MVGLRKHSGKHSHYLARAAYCGRADSCGLYRRDAVADAHWRGHFAQAPAAGARQTELRGRVAPLNRELGKPRCRVGAIHPAIAGRKRLGGYPLHPSNPDGPPRPQREPDFGKLWHFTRGGGIDRFHAWTT